MNQVLLKVLLLGAVAVGLAGCLTAPVMPPPGVIYNNYSAPLHYGPSKDGVGPKMGEASTKSVLGIVAWGDASMDAAAKAGGLTKIQAADYQYFNVLGFYQKYTTVVHGE